MKQREGELERAKAIGALRRSILEAKEELRFELVNLEKKTTCKRKKRNDETGRNIPLKKYFS